MTIAVITSIAVIAWIFFIVAAFLPRPFSRRRSTVVAVASPLVIASTAAVSAFRLVVVYAASVASEQS
jgi:hypothetical protein